MNTGNYLDPSTSLRGLEKSTPILLGSWKDALFTQLAVDLVRAISQYQFPTQKAAFDFSHQHTELLVLIFFLNRFTGSDTALFKNSCSSLELYTGDIPGIVDFILLQEARGSQSSPTEMFASATRFHETGTKDSATLEAHGGNVFLKWPLEQDSKFDFGTIGLTGIQGGKSLQEYLNLFPNRKSEFLERYCSYKLLELLDSLNKVKP